MSYGNALFASQFPTHTTNSDGNDVRNWLLPFQVALYSETGRSHVMTEGSREFFGKCLLEGRPHEETLSRPSAIIPTE